MTQHSDRCDEILEELASSDQVALHVTQTGGIGNVIRRGSNDQKKRGLVPLPLNKVFKLWSRQKHSKESSKIIYPRSSSPPKSLDSTSPTNIDICHEQSPLLPPFCPAPRAAKKDCNASLESYSSSSEVAAPVKQEAENTRLKSYKSLGTIADKSARLGYNPKFNLSAKCLRSSGESTLRNSPPPRLSKDANPVRYQTRISSDRTSSHSHPIKDEPKFPDDSVLPPSTSKLSMYISPRVSSASRLPKLSPKSATTHASSYQPLSPEALRAPTSFDFPRKFFDTPTPQTYPKLPAKASPEGKKKFPTIAQHGIVRNPPIRRTKLPGLGKKAPQTSHGHDEESSSIYSVPQRAHSEDRSQSWRPILSLDLGDESRPYVPPNKDVLPGAFASAFSNSLTAPPNALSSNHHFFPAPRRSSRSQCTGNGGGDSKGTFQGISSQPSNAEALVQFKRLLEVGLTQDENRSGQEVGVASSSLQNCITSACSGDVRSSTEKNSCCNSSFHHSSHGSIDTPGLTSTSVNDDIGDTPPHPLAQPVLDDDFTASTFESDVYDEIENVQFVVGSRLVCADPPLKGIIHDIQSPPISPPRQVSMHPRKSPQKTSNRRGRVFDSCLYESTPMR